MTTKITPKKKTAAKKAARAKALQTQEEATIAAMELADFLEKRDAAQMELERRLAVVGEPFAIQIETYDGKAKPLLTRIKSWAIRKREKAFGDKKTITLAGHELTFRQSPGKVEIENGGTQGDVAQLIADSEELPDDFVDRFVKIEVKLQKAEVIKAWNDGDQGAIDELRKFGIKVTKGDEFSFRPAYKKDAEKGGAA